MSRARRRFAATLGGALAITLGVVVGCGSSREESPPAACPNDLPAACPAAPPSFAATVEPVFERRCWTCHTDGGVAASAHDFSTYDRIYAQRSSILNQVYGCEMPPEDAGQLTAEERAAFLGWFVCKAPNN